MSKKQLNFKTLPDQISAIGKRLGRYRMIIFILLVAAVYGFTILRINTLDNAQPSSTDTASAQTSPTVIPSVDQSAVEKLQQLQNNSVSVQALFEQARNNPFAE